MLTLPQPVHPQQVSDQPLLSTWPLQSVLLPPPPSSIHQLLSSHVNQASKPGCWLVGGPNTGLKVRVAGARGEDRERSQAGAVLQRCGCARCHAALVPSAALWPCLGTARSQRARQPAAVISRVYKPSLVWAREPPEEMKKAALARLPAHPDRERAEQVSA